MHHVTASHFSLTIPEESEKHEKQEMDYKREN